MLSGFSDTGGALQRRDRIIPVSYTHLDVYKRQALIAAALRQFVRDNDLGACVDGGLCIIGLNEACLLYTSRCV